MKAGAIKIQQRKKYQLILNPTINSIHLYIFLAPKIQQIAMVWKNTHLKIDNETIDTAEIEIEIYNFENHHSKDIPEAA